MYKKDAIMFFNVGRKGASRRLGTKGIAEALGITPSAVSQWIDIVPKDSALKLYEISVYKIKFVAKHYERN